jgi:YegS/Rv2252/BmrU family lipid kinase
MIPAIEQLLGQHGLSYELQCTERPGHAVELARAAAAQGFGYVVAAGGDGTINEVVNGLVQAQAQGLGRPALGAISVGRGNDFGYSLQIPHELDAAVGVLAARKTRSIDVGRLTGGVYPQGRCFCNGVGIGFDAVVDFESLKLAPLSGFASYLVAALKTILLYFHAPRVQIELDSETITQPSLMVSVMNGRRMGGGFYMTPESQPNDGLFDLCIAGEVNRFEIFKLMLRFMKGTQTGHPAIQFRRSRRVVVTALTGALPAHADGETMALDAKRLEMEVLPGAINLLALPREVV